MRIGLCASERETILLAEKIGYDYVEVGCYSAVMQDKSYHDLLDLRSSLPDGFLYACNVLIPADLRLTGPDVDYAAIRAYCDECFQRLASLGVQMVVFGSSSAKQVPEGFEMERAMEQLVEVVRIFSDHAERYGQNVCIEPLRRLECNIINTMEDSIALAERVNRHNVGAHVDYFQMMQNGERFSKLTSAAPKIMHTHIASPCARTQPTFDDGADYLCFLQALRNGGYQKTVSFEGNYPATESVLKETYEYLHMLCMKADEAAEQAACGDKESV